MREQRTYKYPMGKSFTLSVGDLVKIEIDGISKRNLATDFYGKIGRILGFSELSVVRCVFNEDHCHEVASFWARQLSLVNTINCPMCSREFVLQDDYLCGLCRENIT